MNTSSISIYITIGNKKAFGLNKDNHLIVMTEFDNIDLGYVNKERIKTLISYLERLSIHLES